MILLPQYPEASSEDWIMFEWILPRGFRHVASVERPSADGNVLGKGEVWDLGQNAEADKIEAQRQVLRDAPANPAIDAATTVEELSAIVSGG